LQLIDVTPYRICVINSRLPMINAQVLTDTFNMSLVYWLTVTVDFRELTFEANSALFVTFADDFLLRFTAGVTMIEEFLLLLGDRVANTGFSDGMFFFTTRFAAN
jgi:hypothetical protein